MRLRRRRNLDARLEAVSGYLLETAPKQTPLILELGCGFGRFALETAAARRDAFIVGLEREENALIIGMERAAAQELENIRFIHDDAVNLAKYFEPGTVDELYIHFCDPWPHWKHSPRRLVSRNFLEIYAPLLQHTGTLTFKTDNARLFAFAQAELTTLGWSLPECDPDCPAQEPMTDYELKFRSMGVPIGRLLAAFHG